MRGAGCGPGWPHCQPCFPQPGGINQGGKESRQVFLKPPVVLLWGPLLHLPEAITPGSQSCPSDGVVPAPPHPQPLREPCRLPLHGEGLLPAAPPRERGTCGYPHPHTAHSECACGTRSSAWSVPALPPHGGSVGTASPSPSQAASPACTCRAHTRAQITSPCEHRSAGCPGQSRAFPTAPPLSHPAPACRSLARDSEAGPNPGS